MTGLETNTPSNDLPQSLVESTQLEPDNFAVEQARRLLAEFFPEQEVPRLAPGQILELFAGFPALIWQKGSDFMNLEPYLAGVYHMLHGAPHTEVADSLSLNRRSIKEWMAGNAGQVSRYISLEELLELAGYKQNGHEQTALGAGTVSLNGAGVTRTGAAERSNDSDGDESEDGELEGLTDLDEPEAAPPPAESPISRRRREKGMYDSDMTSEEFWSSPIPPPKPRSASYKVPSNNKPAAKPLEVIGEGVDERPDQTYKVVVLKGHEPSSSPRAQTPIRTRRHAKTSQLLGLD